MCKKNHKYAVQILRRYRILADMQGFLLRNPDSKTKVAEVCRRRAPELKAEIYELQEWCYANHIHPYDYVEDGPG